MKILIKEEQQNRLKLAPFIYKAIVSKRTSLGDNPALPPYGDFGFEYDVIKSKFENVDEIINKSIERGELQSKDPDYLISVLNKKIERCKELEKPIIPQLQKLCENIVNQYFSIPEDTVILNCKLVSKIKPKNSIRILPENSDGGNKYDFEDVEEIELTNKVILKRRFINSLIQGLSYWLSTDLDDWFDTVFELNNELWGLWYEIRKITDYLLFVKEEKISEKNPNQLSYVEVHLGKNGKKTIIDSQGIIFPYLLRETIRGFFELFSSHGLPEDSKKAMYIIRKADFLVAEPWDLRFGMGIVDMLNDNLTKKYKSNLLFKTNRIPFFFTELCELPTDEFNMVMKNFLVGTKKGKIIANRMDSEIEHDYDYQTFKDKIQQKNIQTSLISDGDFSKEELNDYVIQENETDEMMAYHGSGTDFDKFNHKKYLSTGAGSQCFGWGTYVTDDKAIANGYSNVAGNCIEQIKPIVEEAVKMYGYNGIFSIDEMCVDINSTFKVYRGDLDNIINFYEEKLKNPGSLEHVIDKDYIKILLYVAKRMSKKSAYLYEVEIPDDNDVNYISWYDDLTNKQLGIIHSKMDEFSKRHNKVDFNNFTEYSQGFARPNGGNSIYASLEYAFYIAGIDKQNSAKAASLFLMQCGFDGIKYPAGTRWKKPDGASEDAMNYVIFDANKVKIVNKTKV